MTSFVVIKEQPLLLEELLEQEKREQEKQLQTQPNVSANREEQQSAPPQETDSTLLSDHDFEKLKADVFNTNQLSGLTQPVSQTTSSTTSAANQARANFMNRLANTNVGSQWQQTNQQRVTPTPSPLPQQQTQISNEAATRIPTFNTNLLPAPPLPPEHIVTEQDKQAQMVYEQWLKHQNIVLGQQLKFYETEVQKLRKMRKVSVTTI